MTTSPTSQMVLPNCPHCTGKLHRIHDGKDQYVNCMNCGRTINNSDFESPSQPAEPSNPQTEHEEDSAPHPDTHNPNVALETIRWQNKPRCAYCLSSRNEIIPGTKDGTHICNACDHTFNVRTKTVMEKSTTPVEIWLNALQLYADPERPFNPQALHGEQHADWQAEEVHRLISEAHQRGARTITEIIAIPKAEEPTQPRSTPSSPLRLPEPRDPPPTSAPENSEMNTPNSTAETAEASEVPVQKRSSRPQERSSPETEAHQHLIDLRWPNGVKCPKCQSIDITDTSPSTSSELRCRKCGKTFSARYNTMAHRMSVSNVNLEIILNACSAKPPTSKLMNGIDITTTVKYKVLKRLKEAITLWNKRHNQERNSLTALEYMSVNMFWAIGEEPDMPKLPEGSEKPANSKQPETRLPDNVETQEPVAEETQEHGTTETQEPNAATTSEPETETTLQPDPGDDKAEEKPAGPAEQQQESEAAQEQPSTEPNESSDLDAPPTMQEMLSRMDKMEKMISSLTAIVVSTQTVNCPACDSTNTRPSEALEGFTTCNDCQCHFPTKLAPAAEPKPSQHDHNTPKIGSNGTSVAQSPLINITVHSHQQAP